GSSDETLKKEVFDPLHALIVRAVPPDRHDYFSTVKEALDRCLKGDTLVLLAPDSVAVPEVAAHVARGVARAVWGGGWCLLPPPPPPPAAYVVSFYQ
ncbi:MAG: hypothetical protein MJZ81_11250, partial [Bacteroidales bacterium]|nr:hypothetical protein [Bacteroidales bacterium]